MKCIVYKPVCEYDYELLNFPKRFATKFATKFATFREKLCEINCNPFGKLNIHIRGCLHEPG
jgi:hypothetical protein